MGIKLEVKSRDVEYTIELFRKYTIVQGESGTGKTTLVQRIMQFNRGFSKFGDLRSISKNKEEAKCLI